MLLLISLCVLIFPCSLSYLLNASLGRLFHHVCKNSLKIWGDIRQGGGGKEIVCCTVQDQAEGIYVHLQREQFELSEKEIFFLANINCQEKNRCMNETYRQAKSLLYIYIYIFSPSFLFLSLSPSIYLSVYLSLSILFFFLFLSLSLHYLHYILSFHFSPSSLPFFLLSSPYHQYQDNFHHQYPCTDQL